MDIDNVMNYMPNSIIKLNNKESLVDQKRKAPHKGCEALSVISY